MSFTDSAEERKTITTIGNIFKIFITQEESGRWRSTVMYVKADGTAEHHNEDALSQSDAYMKACSWALENIDSNAVIEDLSKEVSINSLFGKYKVFKLTKTQVYMILEVTKNKSKNNTFDLQCFICDSRIPRCLPLPLFFLDGLSEKEMFEEALSDGIKTVASIENWPSDIIEEIFLSEIKDKKDLIRFARQSCMSKGLALSLQAILK